jgi:hypothetical protein
LSKSHSRLNHYDSGLPQGLDYTERYLLESGLKWTPIKRYTLSMPKGRGKSTVSIQHERLAGERAVEEMRAFWRERLTRLAGILG